MENTAKKHLNLCFCVALFVASAWTAQSAWRWAHFDYTTFDLAFYVQALDGFLHGRNWSSLLGVKPFGNHADFIILLILPVYAIFQHPLTLIIVQNLALAACIPLGWKIARQLGWSVTSSFWLAMLLLLNPILTFVALHEFHPEAFAAPLWLAIYWSWQRKDLRMFWLFLVLFVSCKENLGLVAGAWCFTQLFSKPSRQILLQWSILPGIFIAACMGIYFLWLGPRWNAGNVDFAALYSHLHEKGIFRGAIDVLGSSLYGNLLWVLLLPMLLLPLRRPLALLPALPILLQHLLSWRASEWTIYYHYAAPLLPIFWIATLEALRPATKRLWYLTPIFFLVIANGVAFVQVGTLDRYLTPFFRSTEQLAEKQVIVQEIPKTASALVPLPFQAHLANRAEIYSLHLVLKGLKTLSRQRYEPPPRTDVVVVDYDDVITFDPQSGYYHPEMKTKTGDLIPSSDILLHQFLARADWEVDSVGALTVWKKGLQKTNAMDKVTPIRDDLIDPGTDLVSIFAENDNGLTRITSKWRYRNDPQKVPWLHVIATNPATGEKLVFNRGLCCPEGRADGKIWRDEWTMSADVGDLDSTWKLQALFEDHATRAYNHVVPSRDNVVTVDISWKP